METETTQKYYTVIAFDREYDHCMINFVGIFSTYDIAKNATVSHHKHFAHTAENSNCFEYKIFAGNIDECVNINEYQKIDEEIEEESEEEIKKAAEKQREIENKYKRVKEIFEEIDCHKEPSDISITAVEHIIDYYTKYKILESAENFMANNKFVLSSLKNYQVMSNINLGQSHNPRFDEIKKVYAKNGIIF